MPTEIGHLDRLKNDVKYCIEQHSKADNTQFWRRALVRAFFGLVECLVFTSRKHFLVHRAAIVRDEVVSERDRLERITKLLNATDLFETELTEQGVAKLRHKKHRTLPFLKAIVRLFFDIFKNQVLEAEQLFKTDDWKSLEHSLKIRDRLMHPKEYEDINVTDDEYRQVLRSYSLIVRLFISGLDIALAAPDSESTS